MAVDFSHFTDGSERFYFVKYDENGQPVLTENKNEAHIFPQNQQQALYQTKAKLVWDLSDAPVWIEQYTREE